MKVYFATQNKHKVAEAQLALSGSNIELVPVALEKDEPAGWGMEKVAAYNAKKFAEKVKAPVIVEDTGIFFRALQDFPGSQPKRWFEKLGYSGLLAKLDGKADRRAYFRAVIGYGEPGQETKIFSGELHGQIAKAPKGLDQDVMPYERIFICEDGRYLYEYARTEKDKISHRAKAFRALRDYLINKQ